MSTSNKHIFVFLSYSLDFYILNVEMTLFILISCPEFVQFNLRSQKWKILLIVCFYLFIFYMNASYIDYFIEIKMKFLKKAYLLHSIKKSDSLKCIGIIDYKIEIQIHFLTTATSSFLLIPMVFVVFWTPLKCKQR